jgi:hypothetical protein
LRVFHVLHSLIVLLFLVPINILLFGYSS